MTAIREAPPATATNPLRRDAWVRCPSCGASGEAWKWELQRSPLYAEWTVPVYRCRRAGCSHNFALKD